MSSSHTPFINRRVIRAAVKKAIRQYGVGVIESSASWTTARPGDTIVSSRPIALPAGTQGRIERINGDKVVLNVVLSGSAAQYAKLFKRI